MKKIDLFYWVAFGQVISPLEELEITTKSKDAGEHLWWADKYLRDFLGSPDLPISKGLRKAATELLGQVDAAGNITATATGVGRHFETEDKQLGMAAINIRSSVRAFINILKSEIFSWDSYLVGQKGLLVTSDLITNAELKFPQELRDFLPEQAKKDFRQAGKCLAFEVSTATAFHLMRATETVIREYYQALAGSPWPPGKRDWGEYIKQLTARNANDRVLGELEQIRKLDRNPIIHPELNVEPDKALMLFDMVGWVIAMMLEEIRNLKGKTTP